jgi:dihydrofolate reductase
VEDKDRREEEAMRVTLTTFLSLDGVMQAPGGPEEDPSSGFGQGGWLVPYADHDMELLVADWFSAADAFLLGRKTYQIFAAFWPHVTDQNDPVAAKLNSLPKYMASTTLDKVDWNNSTLFKRDAAEAVAALKQQPGRELQVRGSGDLGQTFMRHDLVDEYRLWIYPVVLSSGKRLFGAGSLPAALKLADIKTTSTGVVIHVYQAAGKPAYGSFTLEEPHRERDQRARQAAARGSGGSR